MFYIYKYIILLRLQISTLWHSLHSHYHDIKCDNINYIYIHINNIYYASGASMESIQLLNKYLEITSDVQSCTLIAIRAFTPKLLQENQVQVWITKY